LDFIQIFLQNASYSLEFKKFVNEAGSNFFWAHIYCENIHFNNILNFRLLSKYSCQKATVTYFYSKNNLLKETLSNKNFILEILHLKSPTFLKKKKSAVGRKLELIIFL
jgi:hypothetical protein